MPTVKLELTIEEINGVLSGLGALPYAQVAGLFEKVKQQAESQLQHSNSSEVTESADDA